MDGEERTIVSRTGASRCVAIGGIVTVSPSEFSETDDPTTGEFQNSRLPACPKPTVQTAGRRSEFTNHITET